VTGLALLALLQAQAGGTPQTSGYMRAGYLALFGFLTLYSLCLWMRWRKSAKRGGDHAR
jgi:hypothetical protein